MVSRGARPNVASVLPVVFTLLSLHAAAMAEFIMPDMSDMSDTLELHVAPGGDDRWSGLLAASNADMTDGPFATLERARDEIRRVREADGLPSGGATVWLHGGVYRFAEPFALAAEDSGTDDAPIAYRAVDGDDVVLSGGKPVDGFEPHEGEIVRADVGDMGLDGLTTESTDPLQPFELFFNGERMDLARWPNRDHDDPRGGKWAYIRSIPEEGTKTTFGVVADSERMACWAQAPNTQVQVLPQYNWRDQFIGIESTDPGTGEVVLSTPTAYDIMPGRRFYVRNVLEELDAPGEWYFDRERNHIYFWPPAPLEEGSVTISYAENVVRIDGAGNIALQGVAVEHSRAAGVHIEDCRNVLVAGCTIRRTGGDGIAIQGGSCSGATGNDVHDTGGGGISLTGGDRPTLVDGGHFALNNHIYRYGRLVKCYQMGVHVFGVGNRVAHNRIHDAPHTAILIHGNEHLIEYNEIYDVALEGSDTGAFYIGRDWSARGNVVRHNVFHDIYGYGFEGGDENAGIWRYETPHGAWPVYLDDCASGTTVFGNVFYRCAMGALHLGGGRDNVFANNVIVECYPAVHTDARWDEFFTEDSDGGVATYMRNLMESVNYREPPYSERYPELIDHYDDDVRVPRRNAIRNNVVWYEDDDIVGFWAMHRKPGGSVLWQLQNFDASTMMIDSNLVWHCDQPVRVEQSPYMQDGSTVGWDEWQAMGFDTGSRIAEPLFVAPGRDDYRLRENSPAFEMGFEPIPMERIGLYVDEHRSTVPPATDGPKRSIAMESRRFMSEDIEADGEWHYPREFMVAGPFPLGWDGTWVDEDGGVPTPAPGFTQRCAPEGPCSWSASTRYATVDGDQPWLDAPRDDVGYLDLLPHFATTDNVVAYARCRIIAKSRMQTRLSVGSNDGVRAWVNGRQAVAAEVVRTASPHQHVVPVKLRAGMNDVLVKVSNLGGQWGAFVAFEDPERELVFEAD